MLQTQVEGPGQISFWWNLISGNVQLGPMWPPFYWGGHGDFGISKAISTNEFIGPLLWDVSLPLDWSDSNSWQHVVINVSEGPHTLVWWGDFTLVLDEIRYTPADELPVLTINPPEVNGHGFQLAIQSKTNAIIQVERSLDLKTWTSFMTVTNHAGTMRLSMPPPDGSDGAFYRANQR
jgi:hypothetical protein